MRLATRHVLVLPGILTIAVAALAGVLFGWAAAAAVVVLTVLEVAMAADSSVPMAGIASRIDRRAQRVFLSIGLVAGVVGARLLLPPLAVAAAPNGTGAVDAVTEAVTRPELFALRLTDARPLVAAFGATFVWLVFAEYLFNTDRLPREPWMGRAEALLARVRRPRTAAWATAALGTVLAALAARDGMAATVLAGGVAGGAAYAASKAVAGWARRGEGGFRLHVYAATVILERALVIFLVFEILDGVYSLSANPTGFSPVVQAVVAGAAVAIGAVFLTRLTAGVVSAGGLDRLRFLKAGAAYVLGVLSVLLWVSQAVPVSGAVAAWFGSGIIGLAVLTSLRGRRSGVTA